MGVKARSLSNDIRRAVAEEFHPAILLWPQPDFGIPIFAGVIGGRKVYTIGSRDKANNGKADLAGIIGPEGRTLWVEVKEGRDKTSEDQDRWRVIIESRGGWWIEGRSPEQVVAEIKQRMAA